MIEHTVAKNYDWLQLISERAGLEGSHLAYQALRAVLYVLRDRVEPDVAAHFSAQLPLLLRGVFYEGWDPAKTPIRLSLAEFLERVENEANLKGTSAAQDTARAVLSVCWDELGEGMMNHPYVAQRSASSIDFPRVFARDGALFVASGRVHRL